MVEGVAELGWLEMVGRLALAALLGGLLGAEREFDGQDAGFRTHLLVVLGAALFGVLSVGGFDGFVAPTSDTNVRVDVTRIAAYVAPGIGFIGGGVILKYGGKVTGITTAASLWSAAAVGVASGLGEWQAAVATAGFTLFALEALQPVSRMLNRIGERRRSELAVELELDADLTAVVGLVTGLGTAEIRRMRFGTGPGEVRSVSVEFWHRPTRDEIAQLTADLHEIEGVRSVSLSGQT